MIPESTLNADPDNHAVPSDLEIPVWKGNPKRFGDYWRSLTPQQAAGLAIVSHGNRLTPDQFARVYLRNGKTVTLTPAR